MAAIQKAERFRPNWRKAAMGDTSQLQVIFGTTPSPSTPRHGDTLDAP